MKSKPFCLHIKYLDYKENTKQIFLCLQTKISVCNLLVTLFTLYQKSVKRKLCISQSSIGITQNHKYGVHSKKYYCQSSHQHQAGRLSKQLIVSVNRLSHVQQKGNLAENMKLEDIVQYEDAMAKKKIS